MTAASLNGGGAPAPTPEGRWPWPQAYSSAPHTLDNGVDMRTTLTLTGIATGIALTITAQRWTPTALWWLFGNGE